MAFELPGPAELEFGPYRVDVQQRLLFCGGQLISLEPKVFETLAALIEARGQLVTKDELLQKIWPQTFVEEGSLARNVSTLRKVLGDSADPAKYIETVPKRGYRFVAPVRAQASAVARNGVDLVAQTWWRRRDPRTIWIGSTAVALLVLVVVTLMAWRAGSRGSDSPTQPMQQLTFDIGLTTMPALSGDGALLAFASDRTGRGDLDIWVQQMAGGTPLRLTDDPADDDSPVFSPDAKQIAFRSDREIPGVYVVPALGGAARLIATGGRRPVFSPDGTRLAYWTGQWRGPASQLSSETFVLSLTDGTTTRVLSEFSAVRDPVWSPDGRSLLVLARRSFNPAHETVDWWFVPLDGSSPHPTRALGLEGLRKAALSAPADLVLAAWSSSGLFYSLQGNLWSLRMSTSGVVEGMPQRLTNGPGPYTDVTVGGDGYVAFSSIEPRRVVRRASLTDVTAAPEALFADSRSGFERTTQTADGSAIVLERMTPRGLREVVWKDLENGRERIVLTVEAANRLSATVSPNGDRIAYTMTPLGNSSEGTGFVVETLAGVPRRLCDPCQLYGFLSDNRRVLATSEGGTVIRVIDAVTSQSTDVVSVTPGQSEELSRPHASPDDRHLAFTRAVGSQLTTFVAALSTRTQVDRALWKQVGETTVGGRPTGWSQDSATLYLLLDTDGFRCLWGQRIGSEGELEGAPYPVRHFHQSLGMAFSTGFGNAVAHPGFLYEISERRGNIWRMRAP